MMAVASQLQVVLLRRQEVAMQRVRTIKTRAAVNVLRRTDDLVAGLRRDHAYDCDLAASIDTLIREPRRSP